MMLMVLMVLSMMLDIQLMVVMLCCADGVDDANDEVAGGALCC